MGVKWTCYSQINSYCVVRVFQYAHSVLRSFILPALKEIEVPLQRIATVRFCIEINFVITILMNCAFYQQLANFVSDLGGSLGLWIGMSVLSFAEVFELLLLIGYALFRKLRKRLSGRIRSASNAGKGAWQQSILWRSAGLWSHEAAVQAVWLGISVTSRSWEKLFYELFKNYWCKIYHAKQTTKHKLYK